MKNEFIIARIQEVIALVNLGKLKYNDAVERIMDIVSAD